MIILYHVFFGLGFGTVPWVYSAEVRLPFFASNQDLLFFFFFFPFEFSGSKVAHFPFTVVGQLSWLENTRRSSRDVCQLARRVCGGTDHQGGFGQPEMEILPQ